VLRLKGRLEAKGRATSLDRVGEITLAEREADRYLSVCALCNGAGRSRCG